MIQLVYHVVREESNVLRTIDCQVLLILFLVFQLHSFKIMKKLNIYKKRNTCKRPVSGSTDNK